jgi:SWIM zinc finger
MAVRLDSDAVRDAAGPKVYRAAEDLLSSNMLGEITEAGGGAVSIVTDGADSSREVWVGVVSGVLVAECDCAVADADYGDLCVHAVALLLAAIREDFPWASAATPPSQAFIDPDVQRLVEVAAMLPPRRLAALVGEHAATDRRLQARLLAAAGRLGPLTGTQANAMRQTIDSIAADATVGEFDLHDVAKAGQWIVEEMQVLAQRPPSLDALQMVEHAARVWDGLAGYLYDAWQTYETEPEQIGGELRAIHVRMCSQLRTDPYDLAERLREIIAAAEVTSCLDQPDDYADVLGASPATGDSDHRRLLRQ